MCGDTVDAETAFVGLRFLDRRGDDGYWDDGNFWILCFFFWDDWRLRLYGSGNFSKPTISGSINRTDIWRFIRREVKISRYCFDSWSIFRTSSSFH